MHKLAFLFPGQGSHFVGMCQSMYNEFSIVRETFNEAEEVLGIDLKKLCFEGPLSQLSKTGNAHMAIFTSSVAIFRTFMKEIGYNPQFLAGHSLGEYSALTCSGIFSFKDGLNIVKYRAEIAAMAEHDKDGGMTIIDNIDNSIVEEQCLKAQKEGKKVYISCYNTKKQTSISGLKNDVMEVEEKILDLGGQITPLFGSAPYHSSLMDEASLKLEEYLNKIHIGNFRYPVVSNFTGALYKDPKEVIFYLKNHFTNPVKWIDTIRFMDNKGITMFVEMGVKNLLTTMINNNKIQIQCFGQKDERHNLIQLFTKTEGYKKHLPTFISKCLVAAVSTENHNWNNNEYEEGVIKPYKRIVEIQDYYGSEKCEYEVFHMEEALKCLKQIFETKIVSKKEQKEWITQILEETGTIYLFRDFQ
ncbi:[acyl-carrier-protein] S-malonyltransferase [Clostridium cavendishii DSM 21758]|uniref:[acyl-carrier-protein] S-malonyltransferase n=1 Tax=Clostridium cavendishii DSM 21758 TaxID=1121302 RepID=A0A1M6KVL0_9CLOT|nr:ACP S-malonyltransferase [Clostridium cavendishii]SHJ63015.1 [acyl-carrier-protein] S-malonyltransferase [Clostridium cavendishii DSM 21758]